MTTARTTLPAGVTASYVATRIAALGGTITSAQVEAASADGARITLHIGASPASLSPGDRAFLRSADETLARAARDGNAQALAELKSRYLPTVSHAVIQACPYRSYAELAAEVLADMADRIGEFDSDQPGTFARWLTADILPTVTANRGPHL